MQVSSSMTIIARVPGRRPRVKKSEAMPACSFFSKDLPSYHRVMQDALYKFLADRGFAYDKTKSLWWGRREFEIWSLRFEVWSLKFEVWDWCGKFAGWPIVDEWNTERWKDCDATEDASKQRSWYRHNSKISNLKFRIRISNHTGALGFDSVDLWKCKHAGRCVISPIIWIRKSQMAIHNLPWLLN